MSFHFSVRIPLFCFVKITITDKKRPWRLNQRRGSGIWTFPHCLEKLGRDREWVVHFLSLTSTLEVPLSKVLYIQLIQWGLFLWPKCVYLKIKVLVKKCFFNQSFVWEYLCWNRPTVILNTLFVMCLNTCCFTPTLLAKLANAAGPEMTVMGRSLFPQWLSVPLWMEMETLKHEMTLTAKPLSWGSLDNGHKAQPMFSLALVFPLCVAKSECTVLPTLTLLTSMHRGPYSIHTDETTSTWMACVNL